MERAAKYFGKPCRKHPEFKGERYAPSGQCVRCARENAKRWKRNNPEKTRQSKAGWRKRWKVRHPEKHRIQRRAHKAKRNARKRNCLPALTAAEQQRITAIYAKAARITRETGIEHHVDHDRPLALGGKHHPDNLLVVPATLNMAKGAKYASTLEFILS